MAMPMRMMPMGCMPMGGMMIGSNAPMMMVPMPVMQIGTDMRSQAFVGNDAAFSQVELEKRIHRAKVRRSPPSPRSSFAPPFPVPEFLPSRAKSPIVLDEKTHHTPAHFRLEPPATISRVEPELVKSQARDKARHVGVCLTWDAGAGNIRSQKQGDVILQASNLLNCGRLEPGDMVTFKFSQEQHGVAVKCMYAGAEDRGSSTPNIAAALPEAKARHAAPDSWIQVPQKGGNKVCHWCGQRGHIMANCTNRRAPARTARSSTSGSRSSSSSSSTSRSRSPKRK